MKPKVFVSIVSHGHAKLIESLGCAEKLATLENVELIIKNNIANDRINLKGVKWLDCSYGLGFGANNNFVFNSIKDKLKSGDIFVVMNPDVNILETDFNNLINTFNERSDSIASINLYKDIQHSISDNSIRKFPKLKDFILSYIFSKNNTVIDKGKIENIEEVDWAAGSFLVFTASHYEKLDGFDEEYFMYCEDIDICYRSKYLYSKPVIYYPHIKAYHAASHSNRNFLSKDFFWHISSVAKFLLKKLRYSKNSENNA
jgi:N-acetylglucosaminyl-diphospho-decaprenol L-rhamnosyltransferase